jgi:DNA repair protein RecO (recombination protein O)
MVAVVTAPFVTDGILLGAVAYGEADRIVTLYTRARGKVSAMAKGARRSRRRFGASLALFVVGDATLRERSARSAELLFLSRFDARHDFAAALGADVVRLAQASYATELLRELTVPHQADPSLLELTVELYAAVAAAAPGATALRAFELRLLEAIGLRPVLDRCLACGADAGALDDPGALVDGDRGGVVCAGCARGSIGAAGDVLRPLPAAARRRLMAARAAESLAHAACLPPVSAETEAAARAAMHALLAAHLHRPMRTLAFIQKLRAALVDEGDRG